MTQAMVALFMTGLSWEFSIGNHCTSKAFDATQAAG